ncbi:MAG: glutaredoxin family protein [Alteromonadaceae bacterium]
MVDIVEDEKLVELYGVHIPVLERVIANDSRETLKLFWPFTAEQVSQLLV